RWGRRALGAGRCDVTVFRAAAGARPKTGHVEARGFWDGARWKAMRKELADEASVSLTRADRPYSDREVHESRPMGFAFGGSILRISSAVESPTLGIWQDLRELAPADRDAAVDALRTLVDEWMTRAAGVQALLARWAESWTTLDSNPYELAC